ncbi:MAG: NnrS family protein [Gammaproteobacteria bacterium]|nr:NnrS family protein [Gammaproteobacteria bacterium]
MKAIWGQAFRPFFLFGALFAALAIGLWGLVLNGQFSLSFYGHALFWHQHEMLFGFVVAIIIGFLLTAVQNWTGLRATHGPALFLLTLVWLLGRAAMLLPQVLPLWSIAVIDLAFIPLATLFFAQLVIRAGNKRNLFLIVVLLLLWVCNLIMHLGVLWQKFYWQQQGAIAAVFVITLIMTVISGRVLPMFTANGTQTPRVTPIIGLDWVAMGSVWVIALVTVFNVAVAHGLLTLLFTLAALSNGWRILRLKIWITYKTPLLWSLHLAALFIPIGFLLFALRYAGVTIGGADIPQTAAIHALTAGAMGMMIIAMMARVALGHSGRPLVPHRLMSLSFTLVWIAGAVRLTTGWLLPTGALVWLNISVIAWLIGFLCFVVLYWRVLTTPRVDGRPG